MSRLFNVLFFSCLIAYLGYTLYSKTRTSGGKKVAEIEGKLFDNSTFKLSQLQGNYVLIDFWGSWCPPCRQENPQLVALYDKYERKNFKAAEGFEILSLAIEKDDKRVHAAIKNDGLRWPYHIIQTSKLVLSSPLALSYGVTDLPTKFLVAPDGTLIGRNMSFTEIDAYLAQRLNN